MATLNMRVPKRNQKVLRRARLLDTLHNNIHRKLSFICAPAGYGKTTLLVDFAEDVDAEIFWYRVLESHTNLNSFFQSLINSFLLKIPAFGEELKDLAQLTSQTAATLAIELAKTIENKLDDFSLLIIDDYHILSDDPEINDFMDTLLEFLPDQLRILIGSRSVYGIPTASLYIQEQLSVISAQDLSFTADELVVLCRQYYQVELALDQAIKIIQESEGWIIAILLALRAENTTIEIPKILGAREHIYQYLANDVVNALGEELKEFMLATSIADQFTSDFANYVLGIEDSQNYIQQLEALNLFLSDIRNDSNTAYRYHQLFSDFLQTYLGKKSPEKLIHYHKRAGDWYYKQNASESAISHYLKANHRNLAAACMNQSAREFYLNGQIKVLESWYEALLYPEDLRERAPLLLLDLAKVKTTQRDQDYATSLLDLAEPLLKQQKDFNNLANLFIARGMIYSTIGDYKRILPEVESAQKIYKSETIQPHYWFQAERLKGISSYYNGNIDEAFAYLKNAANGFREEILKDQSSNLHHDLIMTLADIGYFGLETGQIFEAQSSYKEAMELSKKMRKNYSNATMVKNNYAYLLYLLGDFREAWRIYEQALELATAYQIYNYSVHIYNGQADILRDIGEYDESGKLYRKALEAAEIIHYTFGQVQTFQGLIQLNLLSSNFNEALFYIREIARVKQEEPSKPEYQAAFGKIYLAMKQYDLASKCLGQFNYLSEPPEQADQIDVETCFHTAHLYYQLQDDEKASELLKTALRLCASLGYDHFLIPLGRQAFPFLKAMQSKQDTPQLNSLMERIEAPVDKLAEIMKPPQKVIEEVPSLQLTTFGKGKIRLNGKLLPNQAWHSAGARAVFYLLIDRKKLSKEDIALEFWPDFSPGKINSNFHAILWRIRNALGNKQMVVFNEPYYQINPQVNIISDLNQFESCLEQMNNTDSDTQKRVLMRQVIELYKGDYLVDIDMPWADQRRTEIRNQFIQVLEQLAKIEFNKQNYPEVINHLSRLIELEPFQEQYHLFLLNAFKASGQLNRAKKHYQEYTRKLKDELGLTPGSEFVTFYKNLLA